MSPCSPPQPDSVAKSIQPRPPCCGSGLADPLCVGLATHSRGAMPPAGLPGLRAGYSLHRFISLHALHCIARAEGCPAIVQRCNETSPLPSVRWRQAARMRCQAVCVSPRDAIHPGLVPPGTAGRAAQGIQAMFRAEHSAMVTDGGKWATTGKRSGRLARPGSDVPVIAP
jgi:hypothetical protein